MSKNEFYNKLKSIGVNINIFQQYLIELLNFNDYCKNNNIPYIINFQKRNYLYYNLVITHLIIDGNVNILNILIKDNKNNYYIASIEENNYNLYDTTIKIADNYSKTHKKKINLGERVKDADVVLKYIDYKYIRNIYYENDSNSIYYKQNKFIMYIPFLETIKYKCSCSQNNCYCKKAKYKYIAPFNICKNNNNYIINIITIFKLDRDMPNKYPINI